MSRVARIVAPGFPHHVTQRGNRRADVFEVDADYEAYPRFLKRYADKRGLCIWAYCLMTNHIHLVAVPQRHESLGQALRDAHTVYAMHFNSRTKLSGHVWQGRFFSCALDDGHLWAAVRYVERNPVRAGMSERAEQYPLVKRGGTLRPTPRRGTVRGIPAFGRDRGLGRLAVRGTRGCCNV